MADPLLTIGDLIKVFGSHGHIPRQLISTRWKDGIDIDEPSHAALSIAKCAAAAARKAALLEAADWLEQQRNDVPATGKEFAAALRERANG